MQSIVLVRPLSSRPEAAWPTRFSLDHPVAGIDEGDGRQLRVAGWILAGVPVQQLLVDLDGVTTRHALNRDRPDVIDKVLRQPPARHPQLRCGFDLELPLGLQRVRLGCEIGSGVCWLWDIERRVYPDVIEGHNGWLYLSRDTNRSVDQFTGKLRLGEPLLDAWRAHMAAVDREAVRLGFGWVLSVAPAKEHVLEASYPVQRSRPGAVEQFLAAFKGRPGVRWVAPALRRDAELAYWKGDTHWSEFGAAVAAQDVLAGLGLPRPERYDALRYRVVERSGDLGLRYTPPLRHACLEVDEVASATPQYDNGVSNHGRIWIFESPLPVHEACCLVFGDSFGVQLIKTLVPVFRRLVYVHTAAAVDLSILEHERPNFVVLQLASRFIVTAPSPIGAYSVRNSIRPKLASAPPRQLERVRQNAQAQAQQSRNRYYSSLMLEELQRARPGEAVTLQG